MSTDAEYTSFLERANQDPGSNQAQNSNSKSNSDSSWPDLLPLSTQKDSIPESLRSVSAVYVSEVDEEFEAVSVSLDGEGFGVEEFKGLVSDGGAGDVEELSGKEFDPKGQYKEVLSAVEGVVEGGKVRVFRVEVKGARVWYFVLGKEGERAVGFRVKAVES